MEASSTFKADGASDTLTGTSTASADSSLNTSVASVDLGEEEQTEEELKKAEEYKTKGNDAYKSK